MGPETTLAAWTLALIGVVLAAWRYGADSRVGRDWTAPGSGEPRPAWHGARPSIAGDARSIVRRFGLTFGPSANVRAVRLPGRLARLFVGLIGFGASLAFMVRAGLGLGPWDVLHQGLARQTGLSIGWIVIVVSVLVLVLWLPLRQRPGFGTLANALMVGLSLDLTLAVLPTPGPLGLRVAWLAVGIVANGAATGLYIGAALGPGPRDGLMTGLAQRGFSIRSARTAIELSALVIGWGLGGALGVGTVAYALAIGPLVHYFIPKFAVALPDRTPLARVEESPIRANRVLRPIGSEGAVACASAEADR